MNELKGLIEDGAVHLLDGAMGTLLYERGVFVNICYDELNLTQPELVGGIHREYADAGAEILKTNTFGANPVKLSGFGLESKTEEINRAAAQVARNAGGDDIRVVGAIGPLGVGLEPGGPLSQRDAEAFFERQVRGLLAGQVDGFLLETFSDLDEVDAAIRAVRSLSDLSLLAQLTFGEEGRLGSGVSAEEAATTLDAWDADVIGVNCSLGPSGTLDVLEQMARGTDRPLIAQPNAGLPRVVGDRTLYLASPAHMARYAVKMVEAGARFVGGCCGTTPGHIEAIRMAIRETERRDGSVVT